MSELTLQDVPDKLMHISQHIAAGEGRQKGLLFVGGKRFDLGEWEELTTGGDRGQIPEVNLVSLLSDFTDVVGERDLTERVEDFLQKLTAAVELFASVGVAADFFVRGEIGGLAGDRAVEGRSGNAIDVEAFGATAAVFGCWLLADFALAASAGVDVGCRHAVVLCVGP